MKRVKKKYQTPVIHSIELVRLVPSPHRRVVVLLSPVAAMQAVAENRQCRVRRATFGRAAFRPMTTTRRRTNTVGKRRSSPSDNSNRHRLATTNSRTKPKPISKSKKQNRI